MVKLSLIICEIFTICMLLNGWLPANGCVLCIENTISKYVNSSMSKMHANNFKKKKVITLSITNTVSIKTKLEIPKGCEIPKTVQTTGDLISLFNAKDALDELTPEAKKSAVELLISYHSSLTVPLQPDVLTNLVIMFSISPTLLEELSEPYVKSVLTTMTIDQRTLLSVPQKDLITFFKNLLSMPLHRLVYCVSRSAFVTIVGTISSCPEVFNEIPVNDAINLITVLSMSKSWFKCLPPPFVVSLMKYVTTRPVMQKLPPSTLFGFLEGLFEALTDSSYFLADAVPAPTLSSIVNPLITSRMLSVFPVKNFDLLLAVLGSCPALTQTLPTSKLVTFFSVLTTSPRLLSSLNPNHLGDFLVTVSSSKNLASGVPPSTWENLLESISHYLPESLTYVNCNTKLN